MTDINFCLLINLYIEIVLADLKMQNRQFYVKIIIEYDLHLAKI